MQRFYPTFAQAPNVAKLTDELNIALSIANAGCGYEGSDKYFVDVPDNVTLQQVQTVVNNHNPSILTDEQTKAVARTLMLSTAKNYLSNQLMDSSPNVTNIFTQVKQYVDGNPTLLQMVNNQITLSQTGWGWTLNLVTPTAADRMRYLLCCQLVLATIA